LECTTRFAEFAAAHGIDPEKAGSQFLRNVMAGAQVDPATTE
jgi:hypothetical protein